MNFFKRLLFKILGPEKYLVTVSRLFFIFFGMGFLRLGRSFSCHYYVRKLIKKGDVIIDIGANLGYYTRLFARLTGKNGKVYAVEPVELFIKVLKKNLRRFKNVEIIPFALGQSDNTRVRMGIPYNYNYFSHGRTQVIDDTKAEEFNHITEVLMRNPSTLFNNIDRLNYIKCDIEGHETEVIPEMAGLIRKFRPVIQIETSGDNFKQINKMLNKENYLCFWVKRFELIKLDNEEPRSHGDFIFIPAEKYGG